MTGCRVEGDEEICVLGVSVVIVSQDYPNYIFSWISLFYYLCPSFTRSKKKKKNPNAKTITQGKIRALLYRTVEIAGNKQAK